MIATSRWKKRPAGSNWGEFGPDDQLGCLNYLSPDKVLQGIAEVCAGLSFSLSIPLNYPGGNTLNPNRNPPILRPLLRHGEVNYNCEMHKLEVGATDVLSDDLAIISLQYSTQWDGLAHAGSLFDTEGDGIPKAVYYNGFAAGKDIVGPERIEDTGIPKTLDHGSTASAYALGIEHMARTAVQSRGVMIDLRAHFGDARTLIGYNELMSVLEKDRIEVTPGDIVCLHTGFADLVLSMKGNPDKERLDASCAALDGSDPHLLQWLTESKIAALAADNYAVEAFPARSGGHSCAVLPLHEHCLFKIGLHLGELWNLTPLANWLRAHGRYRFLLTAPPLDLPGAIASPLNPVATV
ncbi:cyclase family protein [Pluralibacter gergoviae]|uniref:cyclase family protein n=1 Tax=Pluralibacter gergoviae TaxID=61647 RepID=UPI0007DAB686|nr:cyclase family protein [Pluralibacter gergoviae]SUB69712.1 Putative cyclase [Pluralibacter gergoviae]